MLMQDLMNKRTEKKTIATGTKLRGYLHKIPLLVRRKARHVHPRRRLALSHVITFLLDVAKGDAT
jgi:hypothetical protein